MLEPSLSYNPASSITLPGVGSVELRGLILIVGPNSSGKTHLLTDIRAAITGAERRYVVCAEVALKPPDDADTFIADLEQSRCLKRIPKNDDRESFRITTSVLGTAEKSEFNQFNKDQLVSWMDFSKPGRSAEFMKHFGKLLIATLFLPNRLETTKHTDAFNHEKEAPKNDLQALHTNSNGQKELNKEIGRAFGKAIAIDSSAANLRLRIFDEAMPDPPRVWPDDTNGLPIEQEGDGLRSFTAICVSLLAGHRPVCVIDEPESCLHPPQEKAIGHFIGKHGSCRSRTTLVATHSSHVLRGVIETATSVQVIRLSQSKRRFSAHLIDHDVLMQSVNRPIVRAETVLDGVFADGVILVESDGDRAVYEAALDAAKPDGRFDVLFVSTGGHGSIPSVAAFYNRLIIPVVVIADLDIILEQPQLRKVLLELSPDQSQATEQVIQLCNEVSERLMRIPPPIDPSEIRDALTELSERSTWTISDTSTLMNKLRELSNKLDRSKILKAGGIQALNEHADVKQLVMQIIDSCKPLGLFLVPVGELEYWASDLMAGFSKRKKAEWANEAATQITKELEKAKDVIEFVMAIAGVLENARNKEVGSNMTV